MTDEGDRRDIWKTFRDLVNMTPAKLEEWLATTESEQAGEHKGGGESTGHASGRAIVGILRKDKGDLTDADYRHMAKVNGYIRRHLAQRPSGDVRDTRWRHSLMNWGHDPSADGRR
ncbi:DUF3140 domain-containing protein [Streptomyces sp. NPDC020472]|uniref:DUF3140 domain-containing protein n=1 Tax=Streptomyces sp. NPDC020472 TaxID=3365075 RepID=UPI00379B046C